MKEKIYILDYEIKKGIRVDQSDSNERTGLAWFLLEMWKLSTLKGEIQRERERERERDDT
jgi:hypothetical protein